MNGRGVCKGVRAAKLLQNADDVAGYDGRAT